MPHNQQFVGVLSPKGLNTHEGRGDYDRVVPVRRKGIRPNKPWQPLTALSTEAYVMAEFLDCSPRFTAAQDVALGGLLEFDRDAWATVNPSLTETLHRGRRECEPQQRTVLLFLCHAYLFCVIGRPSASRIISFEHPAQQIYFLGSSTAIARLSPLLSRLALAQDGHLAIQFRPTCRRTST
jgi:hypothetical protein